MICPRCSAPLTAQARQCPRCGLIFAAPDDPRPGMPRPRRISQARSGTWDTDPPAMQGGASGQWQMPPGGGSASGQWQMPMDPRAGGSGQFQLPPPSPPSRPRTPAGTRTPSAAGQLLAGSTLHNGRFRVLGPYRPMQTPDGRPVCGPLQWVAIDGGRRGERVALMELTFGDMIPALVERARDALVQRMMAMGQHPGLQGVLSGFSDRGRHFLVLEYLEGTFLSDYILRAGPFTERMLLNAGDQLLDVLAFLDRQSPPVLHGHITPDAVVVAPNAQQVRLLSPLPVSFAHALNIPLQDLPPSIGYSAPEQAHGQADRRSDLFSLGATLFYAATGFDAAARGATLFSPARQINPAISAPAEAVLAKAVRQVPSQRYQYPEEMQLDLERARNGEMPNRDALNNMQPLLSDRPNRFIPVALGSFVSVLLVVALVAVLAIRAHNSTTAKESVIPTATLNPTAVALAQRGIGLSTGRAIFDTVAAGDPDGSGQCATSAQNTSTVDISKPGAANAIGAEEAAAQALCKNDFGTAISDFQLATQDDPSNAEPQIYLADTKIQAAIFAAQNTHQPLPPFVTLDVAVSFAPQDLDVSREVLRGAYEAQAALNQSGALPGNTQVIIEIASVGPNTSGATLLADYYGAQLQHENPTHALGVISWASRYITKTSGQNLAQALVSLTKSNVPVVVPVVTTDCFPAPPAQVAAFCQAVGFKPFTAPNYFQLSPTDLYQAGVMAKIATSQPFNASRILIVQDPRLVSNLEIAGDAQAILAQTPGISLDRLLSINSPPGGPPSVTLQQVVQEAEVQGANMILFSGTSTDAAQLAVDMYKANPSVQILASANADDPSLIGQSQSADTAQTAALAKANPQAMRNLHILGLADAGEWPSTNIPAFFNNFKQDFTQGPAGQPLEPSANAIFSYDAVSLMLDSAVKSNLLGTSTIPTPKDLIAALGQVTVQAPYQGISGLIAFDKNGVPDNRALVLKSIGPNGQYDARGNPLLGWHDTVIGTFCATSSCALGFGS